MATDRYSTGLDSMTKEAVNHGLNRAFDTMLAIGEFGAKSVGAVASSAAAVCGSLGIKPGSMNVLWSPSTDNNASFAAATPAVEMDAVEISPAVQMAAELDGVAHLCRSNIGGLASPNFGLKSGGAAVGLY